MKAGCNIIKFERHNKRGYFGHVGHCCPTSILSDAFSTNARVSEPINQSAIKKTTNFYPHLFQPLELRGGITLKNRALMGSMHTGIYLAIHVELLSHSTMISMSETSKNYV